MLKDKLTIAYVSPGWPLSSYPNGIVAYIENIIYGFESNVRAHILTHKLGEGCSDEAAIDLSRFFQQRSMVGKLIDKAYREIGPQMSNNKKFQRRRTEVYRRIIKGIEFIGNKLDLIEVEESFGMAKFLVAETGIPTVTRLHGPFFIHGPILKRDKNRVYQPRVLAEGLAIKCSHGVTSPSLDVLNRVREYYDCSLADAKVIPNPILPVARERHWQYRPEAKHTILYVGRFDLHKGGDIALAAFRIIARQNDDVELLFVGPDKGVIVEGKQFSFQQYVEAFIPECSVKKRITFLGHCDSEQVAELRRNASITIMTSRYENFPMALLEALSTGSPVVSTPVGGIKEIINHGYNGLLSESVSPESVAEKIYELIYDPVTMKRISKNAILHCLEKYHPSVIAKDSVNFYKNIISKTR